MGGFLILLALSTSTLLWADLTNPYVWIVLLVTIGFGLIGFFDDYCKLTKNSHHGLSGRAKLAFELVLGTVACIVIAYVTTPGLANTLAVPFFKNTLFQLGWFFLPFGALVIVGASNAVNLTDGLDGLAVVPSMIAAGCFAVIAYLAGNFVFASYLQIHHVAGAGEFRFLRSDGRGQPWFSMVQCSAGHGFHGRYRLAVDGCGARGDQHCYQARTGARDYWRPFRIGSSLGHRPGRQLQDDRTPRLPDGAAASSLRTVGMAGANDRDPLLDHRLDPGDRRPCHPQTAVTLNGNERFTFQRGP